MGTRLHPGNGLAWGRLDRNGWQSLPSHQAALGFMSRPLPSRCPAATFSSMTWAPWHFLVVAISGWMNREQQQVIDYLREENRIVRGELGRKRIVRNEPQKQRLAAAAMKLGGEKPCQCGTLFSPGTLPK